jgi:hypothetical protein
MPDRLMAGLQILVLTMLVRIQLGQQANPLGKTEGVFCFFSEPQALLEGEIGKQKIIFRGAKRGLLVEPLQKDQRDPRSGTS